MTKHSFIDLRDFSCRGPITALVFICLTGHILGAWFSAMAGEQLFTAMRAVTGSRVSAVGLLSSVVLPFLFSAAAVYLGKTVLLFPIAFWKAFLLSYTAYGLYVAWGSAGWLITTLVMFGSICSMPVLFWYWMRGLAVSRFEISVCCLILGVLLIFWAMDFYLILPFLAGITTF